MKPLFFYLGVFLISGSTLVLQIVQTRILSVVAWYHLAFFVISLAMFGLTEPSIAFNDATLGARIAICVASITPAGLLLGFGFPTGMRLMAVIDSRPTPWFWGINGAAGVLASISAVAVSLALGIASTLILGALCYLLLIPVSLALFQPAPIKASKSPATPARVTG